MTINQSKLKNLGFNKEEYTLSDIQNFLRKEKNIYVYALFEKSMYVLDDGSMLLEWLWGYNNLTKEENFAYPKNDFITNVEYFETYEEALEDGLNYVVENIEKLLG